MPLPNCNSVRPLFKITEILDKGRRRENKINNKKVKILCRNNNLKKEKIYGQNGGCSLKVVSSEN